VQKGALSRAYSNENRNKKQVQLSIYIDEKAKKLTENKAGYVGP